MSRLLLWEPGRLPACFEGVGGAMEEHDAVRLSFSGRSVWGAESRPERRFFMKSSSSGVFCGMTDEHGESFDNYND